ncbi:hypothetical protein [Helcococcus bovis]|uniref:hypothetical protein n=1 Tax=Helcococcus bovis TaxID=3153252 RepID=UPI0038BBBA0B
MSENLDIAIGWDDEIKKDSDFVLLDEGDYDFVITKFEKGFFQGSDKMQPCNQAIVYLSIEGVTTLRTYLLLNRKVEWKLSEFFTSIGMKEEGKELKMNWDAIVGKTGRVTLGHRAGTNGNVYNEVKKFLKPNKKWENGAF